MAMQRPLDIYSIMMMDDSCKIKMVWKGNTPCFESNILSKILGKDIQDEIDMLPESEKMLNSDEERYYLTRIGIFMVIEYVVSTLFGPYDERLYMALLDMAKSDWKSSAEESLKKQYSSFNTDDVILGQLCVSDAMIVKNFHKKPVIYIGYVGKIDGNQYLLS